MTRACLASACLFVGLALAVALLLRGRSDVPAAELGDGPGATESRSGLLDGSALPWRTFVVLCASPAAASERRGHVRVQLHKDVSLMLAENPAVAAEGLVELRFVVGEQGLGVGLRGAVQREHALYSDILLLPNVPDRDDPSRAYPEVFREDAVSATTAKSLQSIKWAVRTFEFEFLVRIGDDSWFRVHRFHRIKHTLPARRLYMGRFIQNQTIPEGLDWGPQGAQTNYSSTLVETFGGSKIPAFAWGLGFVLSHDVAAYLDASSDLMQLRLHYPEDQVVATWLYGLVLHRLDDERFHDVEAAYLAPEYESTQYWTAALGISSACTASSLLVHHVDWSRLPACDESA
mmetsp:Transcript_35/g.107  ORF Transcript_35/g.107 Transcript_35/m.107 type:complete len:347 (-) Transcript_35:236-1276(-)